MSVTYSDNVQQEQGFDRLQRATRLLEEVLGSAAGRVRASWDCGNDEKGRTVYTLHLADGPEELSTTFTLADLQRPREVRYRLIRLWGDVLQIRSQRQLRALTSGNGEPGE